MSNTLQCKTCSGIYQDAALDGAVYYHACPPLSEPEFAALPAGQKTGKAVGAERDNKRDENILLDNKGKDAGVKSPGKGVNTL